jgi:hypothetical protein
MPAKLTSLGGWVYFLPHLNAVINSAASIALVVALVFVKQKKYSQHCLLFLVDYSYFVRCYCTLPDPICVLLWVHQSAGKTPKSGQVCLSNLVVCICNGCDCLFDDLSILYADLLSSACLTFIFIRTNEI